MKNINRLLFRTITASILLMGLATACSVKDTDVTTFGSDAAFLEKHTDAIVLQRDNAAVVVVPQYQGRVMTATANGDSGPSSGWINYDVIEKGVMSPEEAKGKLEEHMYAFGGEERFWMGPEGGQYAIFFAPGSKFEFTDWFTPDPIDTDEWEVTYQSADTIEMSHTFDLQNYSGTRFNVGAKRTVRLLDDAATADLLKGDVPEGIDYVAYQTVNTVTNKGSSAWRKESGLLSIWILCMFQHSPTTTVFIPYKDGPENSLGPIVNADYFGRVPPERLQVNDGVIYFKADGNERGKIGLSPMRSMGIAASYNPSGQHMTLLLFNQPSEYPGYVNSMWELQKDPYIGDAINSYNDGPVDESGEQMGPFYELESSSPALALAPGASATHTQTIIHLYGEQNDLQAILDQITKVDLETVKSVLK
ncbi:MAG: DUF6786 family protein [Puniceicoccaceae bacterium]